MQVKTRSPDDNMFIMMNDGVIFDISPYISTHSPPSGASAVVATNKNKKSSNPLGDDDSDDDFDPLSALANETPKPNISVVTTTSTTSAPAKV